ncbi:unnamed protein product, partial [Prunus brigantina]
LPLVLWNLHDLPRDLIIVNPTVEILSGFSHFDFAVFQFLLHSYELFGLEGDVGWGVEDGPNGVICGGLGRGGRWLRIPSQIGLLILEISLGFLGDKDLEIARELR